MAATREALRGCVNWFSQCFADPPTLPPGAGSASMFARHASEIGESEIQRRQTFQFSDALFWLKLGMLVSFCACWPPECAAPNHRDITHSLPAQRLPLLQFRMRGNQGGKGGYSRPRGRLELYAAA